MSVIKSTKSAATCMTFLYLHSSNKVRFSKQNDVFNTCAVLVNLPSQKDLIKGEYTKKYADDSWNHLVYSHR